MKGKIKFLKMYYKLPPQAKSTLVSLILLNSILQYVSLNVVRMEVEQDTELGKKLLKQLGFEDELK